MGITAPAILRNPHAPLDNITFVKQPVYFLKRKVRRLRVAEVLDSLARSERDNHRLNTYHERHEREVQAHKDEIALPLQVVKQCRGDHDDEEIPDPVGRDANGGSFRAHMQR